MGCPKSPTLRPEVRRELELQGVDAARSWLSAQVDTRDAPRGRTYPGDFSDRRGSVTEERTESFNYLQLHANFIQLAVHLGFIGFLAYWTFVLVGPFIPIIVWSVVLTVALYPVFDW